MREIYDAGKGRGGLGTQVLIYKLMMSRVDEVPVDDLCGGVDNLSRPAPRSTSLTTHNVKCTSVLVHNHFEYVITLV